MPTTQPQRHFLKVITRVLKPFFGLVLILGISRCSTLSDHSQFGLRAPSSVIFTEPIDGNFSRVADPAERAVLSYRYALVATKEGRNVESCENFRALALNLELPESVRLLARVRALPICPNDRVLSFSGPHSQTPPWLNEANARAKLAVARRNANPRELANALFEISFFETTQNAKIERLQEALLQRDTDREKIQERLFTVAPRFTRATGQVVADLMLVANDLRNNREFHAARLVYGQIASDRKRNDRERLRALDGIRMSYKLELKTPEFIKATKKWQNFATTHFLIPGLKRKDVALLKVYLETRIQYARAVWTDHRSAEANKILLATEKAIGRRISIHESLLIRARIAEENQNFSETAALLQKVNIDLLPDRATKAKFLWYKGWNLRRLPTLEDTKQAIATLELAQKYEDRHSDLTRDQFWTARLYQSLGPNSGGKEKARQLFAELAEFSPFGYYGILAKRELRLPFSTLKTVANFQYDPRQASPIPDHIRVPLDWFIALGEFDVGRRYLESFPANEIWNTNWSLDRKEASLTMLSRLEQHITVGLRIDELADDERKDLIQKRPELLFPLPFESRVKEEAIRQGISQELIYSIMRQESLFNTFARSPADAFGLMQLIPEMAAKAAKRTKIELQGPEDLYDPDKNIALGAVFLKDTFQHHENKFILSVAAYNASEKAIAGWVRSRMRTDPLEFIEEIPYDETRLYVKLVLRNLVTYQRRLSTTSVEFPEDVLRLSNVSN